VSQFLIFRLPPSDYILPDVWLFNLTTKKWVQRIYSEGYGPINPLLPVRRRPAFVSNNDQLIIFGGYHAAVMQNLFTSDVYVLQNCNRTDCIIPDSTEAPTEAALSSSSSSSSNVGLAVGLVFCK
jgi:hypothetical protein